jgi:uncharacterized protein (DUF1697 family)
MTRCIALLRGINVGRAKRVPMAALRTLFEELGFSGARTLLNSGNVVFDMPGRSVRGVTAKLERAIEQRFGFPVPVVVVTASDLDSVVDENPLPQARKDPSKFLVAFVSSGDSLAAAVELASQKWSPEAFAIGSRAAYLWCANGIIDSKLAKVFGHLTGNSSTARNWATVLKLQAMAGEALH